MKKSDWQVLGTIAAVGGGVVALHGITSRKWQVWHTVFTVVGVLAAAATIGD